MPNFGLDFSRWQQEPPTTFLQDEKCVCCLPIEHRASNHTIHTCRTAVQTSARAFSSTFKTFFVNSIFLADHSFTAVYPFYFSPFSNFVSSLQSKRTSLLENWTSEFPSQVFSSCRDIFRCTCRSSIWTNQLRSDGLCLILSSFLLPDEKWLTACTWWKSQKMCRLSPVSPNLKTRKIWRSSFTRCQWIPAASMPPNFSIGAHQGWKLGIMLTFTKSHSA